MIIVPGGRVGLVGDGGNNEVATFTDATQIQGEANLTFDGSTLTVTGALTVGVDDTGHDVTFFGATAGKKMLWDESANSLKFTDSTYLYLGTGNDLVLFHDGSNSYVRDVGDGNLILSSNTSAVEIQTHSGVSMAKFTNSGASELYHNGTVRLTTNASGLEINGSLEVATIDYTDGDLAMTIADGGGVTFSQDATFDGDILLQDSQKLRPEGSNPAKADNYLWWKNSDGIFHINVGADGAVLNLDTNNNGTNESFKVYKDATDAGGTLLYTLDAAGDVTITGSLEVATIDYTDGDNAMTIADGGGVSFAQAATFDDDITIDGDGKWLYIKGGATSTNATGIAWTFNSADTRYSEIQMDYDTRASVGFLIHSGYPITMDATTQINFDISGTTYMTLAAAGLTLVADGYIAFGDTDHLIDVNAGHMVFKMPTNEDFYWQHGSTNLRWLDTSASTLYVGLNDSVAGILHALAGASGQAEGGELRLGTAADYDASYNYYFFDAYEDDLRIGRAGNVDGYLRSSGSWEFHGDVFLYGTTPALMLGDGGAEDTKMTLNGNAQDYYMALDDSGDNWVFGRGNSVGSSVSMYFGTDGFLRHNVGVTILDGIPLYFGNAPDYKMYYDNSNTRWAMMTSDSNGSGTDADIIRIEDGQMTIDADATWDDNVSFDIYDDALLLEASKSPTAEAYDFGNGVMKRGQEALIEAGVLKRYDDGWVGYNDQRMAALLAGGIYQTRQLVDEMKEKISELENKVKKLGG